MSGPLAGKIALITGASRGLGAAVAERLAREGAHLVLTGRTVGGLEETDDRVRAAGGTATLVPFDLRDFTKIDDLAAALYERYGRLDILVANAGVIPLRTIIEATPADWDEVMGVDGRGMFLTCKYAVEQMLKTGGGSIVCLSSISGIAGQKSQSTYGPAKFVATGLTKHLAIEWADRNIRVNAVAPGTIRTERVQRLPEEPGGTEYIEAIERMHPMGRLGEPHEVAQAILFLASDDASFITGAILAVDGGYLAQ
jgi:NAD(P)-dependent dehydrogenase (short-subunit alcohol dehydrogenase family)